MVHDLSVYGAPTQFDDPVTGRCVRRLTVSPYHDKHTYYDVSPWHPLGDTLLVSSADPNLLPDAPRTECHTVGHVLLMDANGGSPRHLAGPAPFNMHIGCFAHWTPDGRYVFYGDEYADPLPCGFLVDVESGLTETFDDLFPRMVHPDGTRVLCQTSRGVALLHLPSLDVEPLVDYPQLVAARPERPVADPYLANLKWSPDGAWFLLRFCDMYDKRSCKELYMVRADGSELRWVESVPNSFHHHSWHPDGEQILYGAREGGDPRLYCVHRDGGPPHLLSDAPLGGHPMFHPDGRRIITDGDDGLWLVDTATGKVEQVVTTAADHDVYCQAHPVWTPDGQHVLFDATYSGTCQIYQVEI